MQENFILICIYDVLLASWLPSKNDFHLKNLKAKITSIHVAPPWYVYGCCGVPSGRTDIDLSPAQGTEPTANAGYNGDYRHYGCVTHEAQRHFWMSVQFCSEKLIRELWKILHQLTGESDIWIGGARGEWASFTANYDKRTAQLLAQGAKWKSPKINGLSLKFDPTM